VVLTILLLETNVLNATPLAVEAVLEERAALLGRIGIETDIDECEAGEMWMNLMTKAEEMEAIVSEIFALEIGFAQNATLITLLHARSVSNAMPRSGRNRGLQEGEAAGTAIGIAPNVDLSGTSLRETSVSSATRQSRREETMRPRKAGKIAEETEIENEDHLVRSESAIGLAQNAALATSQIDKIATNVTNQNQEVDLDVVDMKVMKTIGVHKSRLQTIWQTLQLSFLLISILLKTWANMTMMSSRRCMLNITKPISRLQLLKTVK